jgi:amino acid transporter
MGNSLVNKNATFGTFPVFLTAISTILGAILFLRFGYAVGNIGLIGVFGIIIIGHLVTVPTAMAVAEIATNQRVLGGGAYYIISRSFGLNIGAAIGIALYLSQAISVAFYIIAFAEAFEPVIDFVGRTYDIVLTKKMISLPVMFILSVIVLIRGANVGMKALYVVVSLLFVSILMFLFGNNGTELHGQTILNAHIENPDDFFYVFKIIFPAFTGLAAGLGLSGDLKDPRKSIPKGTIWATIIGIIVYILVAYKLAISASPEDLASDQLIMQRIAIWGPIIPIGLAAASLSSAIGSVLVAPRTLQAIGYDRILPNAKINNWFARGKEKDNDPVNGSLITIIIAFIFIAIGDVDFVAKIISMFFMVTYGAICMISFLEHFAADPSYRPTFRSKWYISLLGAVFSFWLMVKMDLVYAALSVLFMALIYYGIGTYSKDKRGLVNLFRGVIFQLARQLQVFTQRADKDDYEFHWRPFAICISHDTFKRRSAFDVLRWISYKYGFGTYIHYIKGFLNSETNQESKEVLSRLINLAAGSKNKVYLDTIISPSYTSAIAQVIQLTSISGKINNLILFEFSRSEPDSKKVAMNDFGLIRSADFDICILNTSYKSFGYKREIHIWITSEDYENANLMILLGYIILGHPEWRKGFIKIFAIYPASEMETQKAKLLLLIKSGRLPISQNNIELIPREENTDNKAIIRKKSIDADFIIIGFREIDVEGNKEYLFEGYEDIGNILFVNSNKQKPIK